MFLFSHDASERKHKREYKEKEKNLILVLVLILASTPFSRLNKRFDVCTCPLVASENQALTSNLRPKRMKRRVLVSLFGPKVVC